MPETLISCVIETVVVKRMSSCVISIDNELSEVRMAFYLVPVLNVYLTSVHKIRSTN